MGLFDRNDYGRDYDSGEYRHGPNRSVRGSEGYRGGGWNRDRGQGAQGWGEGYRETNRDYGGNPAHGGYAGRDAYDRPFMGREAYDRGFMGRGSYDREFGARADYDRGYETGRGVYDREYKTRAQADMGDPFGDRQSGTPFRMMRGEYRADYDRGYRGDRARYDRGFAGGGRYDRGFTGRGVDRSDRGWMGRPSGVNNEPYHGDIERQDRGYPRHERDWF